jgi:hypothetical protein
VPGNVDGGILGLKVHGDEELGFAGESTGVGEVISHAKIGNVGRERPGWRKGRRVLHGDFLWLGWGFTVGASSESTEVMFLIEDFGVGLAASGG